MVTNDYVPDFGQFLNCSSPDKNCPFYKDCSPFPVLCIHQEAPNHHTKKVACRPEYCPLLGKTRASFGTKATEPNSLTNPQVIKGLHEVIFGK